MTRLLPPPGVPTVFSRAFVADPHPTYDWLREFEPVYREPMSGMVLLTRYRDVVTALTHPGLSAAGGQEERSRTAHVPRSMLNTDGDEHERLRRPAAALVGPATLQGVAEKVQVHAERLLDDRPRMLDVVTDVARPIATSVMTHLLGLDHLRADEVDRHCAAVEVALNPVPSPAQTQQARVAAAELETFLDEALDDVRPHSPLGRLSARPELSRAEVRGVLALCIVGGWAPLADLLASSLQIVLASSHLRQDINRPRVAEDLIEEMLRWHSPIPFVARRADRDVEIVGETLPQGQMVLAVLAAANRDPAVFDTPHEPRLGRPRRHVALGHGPHFCLGAGLIRTVLPGVLTTLVRRLGPLPDDGGALGSGVRFQPGVFPRRVVPVEVTPAAAPAAL